MSEDSGDIEMDNPVPPLQQEGRRLANLEIEPDYIDAEDATTHSFKMIMSASLIFDFVTGCIGLISLLQESTIRCCGSAVKIPKFYLWFTLGHIALVVVEIFPVIFRRVLWLTAINPFLGLVITNGLIYSSNREETIAVLFFELSAVAMTWYTLKYIEGKRFCCSLHVLGLIPTFLIVLIAVNYLSQAGECITSDQFESSDSDGGSSFIFGISKSDGTADCKLCEADGLPWTPDCASNVGNTTGSYFGTYCGDEAKNFCFFDN